MAESKEIPASEVSLKRISWETKMIAQQLQELNQNLNKLLSVLSQNNHADF